MEPDYHLSNLQLIYSTGCKKPFIKFIKQLIIKYRHDKNKNFRSQKSV